MGQQPFPQGQIGQQPQNLNIGQQSQNFQLSRNPNKDLKKYAQLKGISESEAKKELVSLYGNPQVNQENLTTQTETETETETKTPIREFKNNLLYNDSKLFTGVDNNKYYVDGELAIGTYNNKYYENGNLFNGTKNGIKYTNGVQQKNTVIDDSDFRLTGNMNNDLKKYMDLYNVTEETAKKRLQALAQNKDNKRNQK